MDIKEIIDPHHHLWDLENLSYPWLRQEGEPFAPIAGSIKPLMKSYLLRDYKQDSQRWNVVGDVHMEALSADKLTETQWLQKQYEDTGFPTGIVAHADLEASDVQAVLEDYAKYSRVRGVRQILNWHTNARYRFIERNDLMRDPDWLRGFAMLQRYGFSFDLQLYPSQMLDAARVASSHSSTTMIINHAGMPLERDACGIKAWKDGMAALASNPNVNVKISGFGLVDPSWTVESIKPFVHEILELFGIDRCMFASNYPVDSIYASFDRIYESYFTLTQHLSKQDRQKLFHDNAKIIYRL